MNERNAVRMALKWALKDGTFDWLREAADVMLTYGLLYAADHRTKKKVGRFIQQMYKGENGEIF